MVLDVAAAAVVNNHGGHPPRRPPGRHDVVDACSGCTSAPGQSNVVTQVLLDVAAAAVVKNHGGRPPRRPPGRHDVVDAATAAAAPCRHPAPNTSVGHRMSIDRHAPGLAAIDAAVGARREQSRWPPPVLASWPLLAMPRALRAKRVVVVSYVSYGAP